MILAGDIGGSTTRLGLFTDEAEGPLAFRTARNAEHDGLASIIHAFLSDHPAEIRQACFGVAGPVRNGHADMTNLAWHVDTAELAADLGLNRVRLLNDLEANGHGIATLGPDDLAILNEGDPEAFGNAAVISAGTGLGEAGLHWDGERYHPFATEGGHADFAPRNNLELALRRSLEAAHGRVSYELVCSGMGLAGIYRFLGGGEAEPATISSAALAGSDERAVRALDLMVSIYGAEAGNLALKMMATGGIYLGGGIAPKILPKLLDGSFMAAFVDKEPHRALLERIPVRVILDDKTALRGAARFAALDMTALVGRR
jgi:glucokinase